MHHRYTCTKVALLTFSGASSTVKYLNIGWAQCLKCMMDGHGQRPGTYFQYVLASMLLSLGHGLDEIFIREHPCTTFFTLQALAGQEKQIIDSLINYLFASAGMPLFRVPMIFIG